MLNFSNRPVTPYGGAAVPARSALAFSSGAFTAASQTHADMRGWNPRAGSPDGDMLYDLSVMQSRSRDLIRNHGVASGGLQTLVDNVLGTGLWLAPTPDYKRLGKPREWAREWRRQVKSYWREWAESVHCDAARSMSLDGLGALAFRGMFYNGAGLALPLWLPEEGAPAATRIQIIESDRLCNPVGRLDSDSLRGGIEIDQYGAPLAYWIRRAHPGDALAMWSQRTGLTEKDWERIPAQTTWGRKRVIHLHDKERGGQSHGVPALASVLRQFKVLGDYQNAELKAAVVNAMVAVITESALGQEQLVELLSSNTNALTSYTNGLASRGRAGVDMASGGQILPLMLGEKFSGFSPARPSTAFEPFTTAVFRHIATGLNIPYELLMKDFSKTNYSSARAALLEAWRYFSGRRNNMGMYFYQPIYELWLEEMVNAGKIEAPNFYEYRCAYSQARWYGPGRGWVDPVKEGEAAALRMREGLSTLEAECAEQGRDWEEVLEQIAEEQARKKELNVILGGTPSVPAISPAKKFADNAETDDTGKTPGDQHG